MTDLKTETEFRTVVSGSKTVLICFHSTRSTYSRRTVQILAEVEADFRAAEFCLVDADRDVLLPLLLEFQVVGLPTILIFRSGVQTGLLIGERSKKSFAALLESFLNP